MSTGTTTQIPAERTRPGVGLQRINAYRSDGTYSHQVIHHGTEAQARAKAALGLVHHTDPRHAELVAILRGQGTTDQPATEDDSQRAEDALVTHLLELLPQGILGKLGPAARQDVDNAVTRHRARQ